MTRNQSIDILRGIAIILVVAGHANRGVIAEGLSDHSGFRFFDYAIYSVHMPIFFYLSGYFCFFSLKKQQASTFVRSRIRVIVRPYIIWSVITFVAGMVMKDYTHIRTPVTMMDLSEIGWKPIGVLWFLYALFVMQVAATFIWRRSVIALISAVVIVALVNGIFSDEGNVLLERIIAHTPFFFSGLFVASIFNRPIPNFFINPTVYLLLLILIWLPGVYLCFTIGITSPVSLVVLPLCAAGVLALGCVSIQLTGTSFGVFLAKIGKASMPIYLLHIFVLALVPRLLKALDVDQAIMRIVLGTLIGVLGAYIVSVAMHRIRLSRLFGFYS